MKNAIKWFSIIGGSLIVLIIIALLLIPMFVNIQQYKPEIEKWVSEATGHPLRLGGDLELSLFPWAGISLSGLHLGNPPGFKGKDLLTVKSFEVRVKLIPLISKDVQIKRFILKEPRIALIRNRDGRTNWEGIGSPPGKGHPRYPKKIEGAPEKAQRVSLSIKALAVGKFSITGGSFLWIDQVKGERKEISDLTIRLKDVSLNSPISLSLSARLDGHPISIEGAIGPVGKEPGKGPLPLDLTVKAIKQLNVAVNGKIIDPSTHQQFDLSIRVSPFSPRKLLAALGRTFPVTTSDPKALDLLAFKARIMGNPTNISLSQGIIDIDQSKIKFSASAKHFSKPDVTFDLNLDQIDIDKYLPSSGDEKPAKDREKAGVPKPEREKKDYTPLRKLVLDGVIRIGELKAKDAGIQDIYLKISGENGRFHVDPLRMKLFQGNMTSRGTFDVSKNIPKSDIKFQIKGVRIGPLTRNFLKKDFLEGAVQSRVAIRMAGDDAETIKKTLNGNGDILLKNGVIKGIDLVGMARNLKAHLGLAKKDGPPPRSNFSELHSPFTITDGVINTPGATMSSPLLRVLAAGKADLVKETLDFRLEPKFVATLKGQKDTKQRAGITVPILISGSFSSPTFRFDLNGMLQRTLKKGLSKPSELKKLLEGSGGKKENSEPVKEKVKGLLKNFGFSR